MAGGGIGTFRLLEWMLFWNPSLRRYVQTIDPNLDERLGIRSVWKAGAGAAKLFRSVMLVSIISWLLFFVVLFLFDSFVCVPKNFLGVSIPLASSFLLFFVCIFFDSRIVVLCYIFNLFGSVFLYVVYRFSLNFEIPLLEIWLLLGYALILFLVTLLLKEKKKKEVCIKNHLIGLWKSGNNEIVPTLLLDYKLPQEKIIEVRESITSWQIEQEEI